MIFKQASCVKRIMTIEFGTMNTLKDVEPIQYIPYIMTQWGGGTVTRGQSPKEI